MTGSPQYDAWIERARNTRIEEIARQRGIKLNGKTKHTGPCPKCGGIDRFSINTRKGLWNCRVCDRGGDVIAFVEHFDGIDFNAACEALTGEPPPRAKPNGHNGKDHATPVPKKVVVGRFDYTDADGRLLFQVERVEFQNPDGSFVLAEDGKRKKNVPAAAARSGQARRLALQRRRRSACAVSRAGTDRGRRPRARDPHRRGRGEGRPASLVEHPGDLLRRRRREMARGTFGVPQRRPRRDRAGQRRSGAAGTWTSWAHRCMASPRRSGCSNCPTLPAKGDISDWEKAGHTADELWRLVETDARPWAPRDDHEASASSDETDAPNGKRGEQKPNKPATTLHFDRIADVEPEAVQWIWSGRIARGKLTLIGRRSRHRQVADNDRHHCPRSPRAKRGPTAARP